MPFGDGTGPLGLGPGTGWGRGPCGMGFRRWFRFRPYLMLSKEEEIRMLEAYKQEIEKRLKELKSEKEEK